MMAFGYDIRYRSDIYDFGWVSQESEDEHYCHSQLQRDYEPWDLYTVFTRGNTIPYQIISVHQQFESDGGTRSSLYTVETGQDSASVFCIQRDRAVAYEHYKVDYAGNELIYNLSLLDPVFPYHLIRGTAYFEGTGVKVHEIQVNGEKKLAFKISPNKPYDFEFLIPREFYQNHRVKLNIKSPEGAGVYLADLKLYRIPDENYGGGAQSSGSQELIQKRPLVLSPNPFNQTLSIKLQLSKEELDKACLKIFDSAGRLVKSFTPHHSLPSTIKWEGSDDRGKQLPNGVYFIELMSGNNTVSEKIILLR